MYTNEDFERLLVKYTSQGLPAGESLQRFCDRNKVPYNLFDKWYRDTRHSIVKVEVEGMPEQSGADSLMEAIMADIKPTTKRPEHKPMQKKNMEAAIGPVVPDLRLSIDLRTSSGLHVSHRDISYRRFLELAKHLEALC